MIAAKRVQKVFTRTIEVQVISGKNEYTGSYRYLKQLKVYLVVVHNIMEALLKLL